MRQSFSIHLTPLFLLCLKVYRLCSIFPRPYYARHYAGIIHPSLLFYTARADSVPKPSAALGPSKEVLGLVPSSLARPADVFLPHWYLGRPAALDVHITSPLQEQTIAEAAFTPGHALQAGVQRKLASNLSACRATGTDFIPLVAETFGGLAEDTVSTVSAIARAISDRSHATDPATTSRHLFGRLAIALWSGNAGLWLHRHPTLPPFLDGVV